MKIRYCLTLVTFAATSSSALAHPGHGDPGIHAVEWLIALAAVVAAGLFIRSARKRFTSDRVDRADIQQT